MRYHFEDFVLDADKRELRRGTECVSIAPQVFDLLGYFDPFHPPLASFFEGVAHCMLKEYSQALAVLGDFVSRAPTLEYGHLWLAVIHAKLGQLGAARAEIAEVLLLNPDTTIARSIRVPE